MTASDTGSWTDRALAVLAAGPMDEEALLDELGLDEDSARDADGTHVLDDMRIVALVDGRLASGPALVGGVTAWHRVSAGEVADRTIVLGPDLTVLAACGADVGEVHVGDEVSTVVEAVPTLGLSPVLELPDGWCPDLAEGDLVALTATWPVGEKVPVLTLVEPPATPPELDEAAAARMLEAIGAAAARWAEPAFGPGLGGGGAWAAELDDLLPAAVAADPTALRDMGGPLADVLEGAGMTLAGGVLGGPGLPGEVLLVYALGRRIGRDPDWAMATAIGGMWVTLSRADADLGGESLLLLSDPDLCDALAAHVRNEGSDLAGQVAATLERIDPAEVDLPDAGLGARWLLAEALIADDRVVEAHEVLARGVGDRLPLLDAEQWVAPIERYAQGRAFAGDLDAAIGAYGRIEEDRIVELLRHWLVPARSDVGRNDPCPCGSGRKHKRCCLQSSRPRPLADRVPLVWWKAMTMCLDDHGACLPDPRWLVEEGLPIALAIDTHLVEDSALSEVIDRWGPLLPDDEVGLLRTWAGTRRRVWDTTDDAGGPVDEVDLIDVATGETVRVPSDDLPDGDGALVAVVVEVEGLHRVIGEPVLVPDEAREAVAEGLDAANDREAGTASDRGADADDTGPTGSVAVLDLIRSALGERDGAEAEARVQQALASFLGGDEPG